MSVIDKLSTSLGRRDETANQELAKVIVRTKDKKAVKELIDNLANKDKGIQSDCIKTLYEIGAAEPFLMSAYAQVFIDLLSSKNNRMQWGAMTALSAIVLEVPDLIFHTLNRFAMVVEKGSVITRDHYVTILTQLATIKKYNNDALDLLNEQILKSPVNQVPMYAEKALPVISPQYRQLFIDTLQTRLDDLESEPKRKRIMKVLKYLTGK